MSVAGGQDQSHVVAGRGVVVLRALGSSGAGPGGFGCTGWRGDLRVQVPEPAADPGRAEFVRLRRLLPRPSQVRGQGPGRRSRVWAAMISQVRRSAAAGSRKRGRVQPRGLFQQSECMFDIESPQERHPTPVDLGGGGAGAGPPQPHRLRVPARGQVDHVQADHRSLDDRQLAGVLGPGRPMGQDRVQPIPGLRPGRAVEPGVRDGSRVRVAPGVGPAEDELGPVLGRASVAPVARRGRPAQPRAEAALTSGQ